MATRKNPVETSMTSLPQIQLPSTHGRPPGFSNTPASPTDDAQDSDSSNARVLHLGLDFGTAHTGMIAAWAGETAPVHQETLPTLVGYAKDGTVENLIPGNPEVLFAQEAVRHRLHLDMVQPVVNGMIGNLRAAQDFAKFLREKLPQGQRTQIRAVVGIPCDCDAKARRAFREALSPLTDRCILVPKPFLAAVGARPENPGADSTAADPIRNALLADLGAGSTDLCVIQGCYPSAEEQIHLNGGGDSIDDAIMQGLLEKFPDIKISPLKLRELKEQCAWAGTPETHPLVELFVNGRLQRVDLTQVVEDSCHRFLERIADSLFQLISAADAETVAELISQIFLTGGGSQIRNICRELERRLQARGVEGARVRLLGNGTSGWVALGALKASQQAREKQWQLSLK